MTAMTMNHGGVSNRLHTAVSVAAGTTVGTMAGAIEGALTPLRLQVKMGGMLGYAFGRVVGLPVGVVCKGVIGLANKFRSTGNQLPSKSINQYSINIAETGSVFGKGFAFGATIVTWPLLLKIAPYTAAVGAAIGGVCGCIGGVKVAQGSHDDSRRGAEDQDNLSLDGDDSDDYTDSDPDLGSIDVESGYGSGSGSGKVPESVYWWDLNRAQPLP